MSPNWFLGIWTLDPLHQLCATSATEAFNFTPMDFSIYILEIGLNFNRINLSISSAESHLGYITGMFSFKTKFELEL